jgi:transcriptional regulator with GAF, ATPase, and Fis domain
LNLYRALPDAFIETGISELSVVDTAQNTIRTMHELQKMERENIIRALEMSNWKVSGEMGAAKILDIPPTTLNSRIKALDIKRQ